MSFSYLPFFTGDYLRDTPHLSMTEHGAYFKLLMFCWDQKGPAPLDERKLYGICNARSKEEMTALQNILNEFFVRMDDGFYNKRMMEEITKSEALSKKNRANGLKSAAIRRARVRTEVAKQRIDNDNSTTVERPLNTGSASVEGSSVSLSPSPSLSSVKEKDAQPTAECRSPNDDRPYKVPDCPYGKIVDMYHELVPTGRRVEVVSPQRKRHMQARWREVCADEKLDQTAGIDWFRAYFSHAGKSRFLTGRAKPQQGKNPFVASIDFLFDPERFVKVYEGAYHHEEA